MGRQYCLARHLTCQCTRPAIENLAQIFLLQSLATKALVMIMYVGTACALLASLAQHEKCIRRVASAGSSNTPDNGSNILGATPATSSVKGVEGGMSVVPGSVAARVGARPTMPVHVCDSLIDWCGSLWGFHHNSIALASRASHQQAWPVLILWCCSRQPGRQPGKRPTRRQQQAGGC